MDFTKMGLLEIGDERVALRPITLDKEFGKAPILTAELMPVFQESNALAKKKNHSTIERVVFNDPATIVIWKDGTKTVVKCQEGDIYDAEKGLALCIAKKFLGNKGNFNEVFKKWIPKETKVYEAPKNGGPKVGTKIKIIDTKSGCMGAIGCVGVVTRESSRNGLLSTDPGYNIKTIGHGIWRIHPDSKIEVLREV